MSSTIVNSFANALSSGFNIKSNKRINKNNRGVTELKNKTLADVYPVGSDVNRAVISGVSESIKTDYLIHSIRNSLINNRTPVILYEGDNNLAKQIPALFNPDEYILINSGNPGFEPFFGMSSYDINTVISDISTKKYDLKKNFSYYIDSIVQCMSINRSAPTLARFQKCLHASMIDQINDMVNRGTISDTIGQDLQSKLMMGQSEQFKLEAFFDDLYNQIFFLIPEGYRNGATKVQRDLAKKNKYYSICKAINEKKIIAIDIASNFNTLLIELIAAEIKLSASKGNGISLILNNVNINENELLKKLILLNSDKCKTIITGNDVYSECNCEDKLFDTIIGNAETIAVLAHSSQLSCKKWSETIGYYDKLDEAKSFQTGRHSSTSLFPGANASTSINYSTKREYIVKPEEINRMQSDEMYYYSIDNKNLQHITFA